MIPERGEGDFKLHHNIQHTDGVLNKIKILERKALKNLLNIFPGSNTLSKIDRQ